MSALAPVSGVWMNPGEMQLARSAGPYSRAAERVRAMTPALAAGPAAVTPETKAAYLLFAQCARHERRWALLDHVARLLVAHEPSAVHTALLARAQIGFGQYAAASIALAPFLKPGPKEADVSATAALASCRN